MSDVSKHKLSTKSLTEADLVTVEEGLTKTQWTTQFTEAQDYPLKFIIPQDIMEALYFEKNGQASYIKRSRHFSMRYFYVKYLACRDEVGMVRYSTANMFTDFFKLLQCSMVLRFREVIIEQSHASSIFNQ